MSLSTNLQSPARPGAGSLQTLAVPHHSTPEFRSSFKGDLKEAVLYENNHVSKKLLGSADEDLERASGEKIASAILEAIKADKDCVDALKTIETLATQKEDEEVKMYAPLQTICDKVETELAKLCKDSSTPRPYHRKVISTSSHRILSDDPVFPDIETIKPDFVIADVPASPSSLVTAPYTAAVRWRQCPAFIEVKPKMKDSPTKAKNRRDKQANATLVQGADYARLILASHPFNFFTYGIFISGNEFCVGLFDRCGIVLSQDYKLTDTLDTGLQLFIRIIARLFWEMSPYDLGQDPSVRMLDNATSYGDEYPRYKVAMGPGYSNLSWETVGHPLWVSQTLLGRGTSVWRVMGPSSTVSCSSILKTAWRSSGRTSELEIYDAIKKLLEEKELPYPEHMVKPNAGGDVQLDHGIAASVTNIRGADMHPSTVNGVSDRVLHRVSAPKVGKPIWKYTSIEQFVRALLCVIEAHKTLSQAGILHRDISAGNILIEVKPLRLTNNPQHTFEEIPDARTSAFLTDFELASVPSTEFYDVVHSIPASSNTDNPRHLQFTSSRESSPAKSQPGEGITGTALFMALEVLEALKNKRSIIRSTEHDVESFCWVILYAVYMHSLEDDHGLQLTKNALARNSVELPKDFKTHLLGEFRSLFSGTSIEELYTKRAAQLSKAQPEISQLPSSPNDPRLVVEYLLTYARYCEPSETRSSPLVGALMIAVATINKLRSRRQLVTWGQEAYRMWEDAYVDMDPASGSSNIPGNPQSLIYHSKLIEQFKKAIEVITQGN